VPGGGFFLENNAAAGLCAALYHPPVFLPDVTLPPAPCRLGLGNAAQNAKRAADEEERAHKNAAVPVLSQSRPAPPIPQDCRLARPLLHGFFEFVAQIGLERRICLIVSSTHFVSVQSTSGFIMGRRRGRRQKAREPSFKPLLCHELEKPMQNPSFKADLCHEL